MLYIAINLGAWGRHRVRGLPSLCVIPPTKGVPQAESHSALLPPNIPFVRRPLSPRILPAP